MENVKENKVKELIYVFLEDAPTIWGLPIAFLDNDILTHKKKGFVYLDFTTSVDLDGIINKIYSDIKKSDIEYIFENFKGLNLNTELFSKIRYAYHIGFYNDLHLNTKKKCANYLLSVLRKYTKGLDSEDRIKFYKKYKVDNSYYARGILDYDYSLLNLSEDDKNLINNLNKSIEISLINFVKQNNILPKESNKQGLRASIKTDISKVLDRDIENTKHISERIVKLLNKHNKFYTSDIKQYKNIIYYKLPDSNIQLPIIKIASTVKSDVFIYITPFSAYVELPMENSKQILNIYHIGRNNLKECKSQMNVAINKFKFPNYCISFIDLLTLR